MLIGHRVIGNHIRGGTQSQVLVGRISSIKAVAAVEAQCQPGNRRIERVAQDGTVIDVAVIGRNAAGDRRVFSSGVHVGNRNRRIIGAGHFHRNRLSVKASMTVTAPHRVGQNQRLADSQKIEGLAVRIECPGQIVRVARIGRKTG